MPSWTPRVEAGSGPKYLVIAEALAFDIRTGRLKPGDRLPPHRVLAKELGVDLTTVTRAFNEARRQGLIEANAGRGSFVRVPAAPLQAVQPISFSPNIDLSMNMPPQPAEARLGERIQSGIDTVLASPNAMLHLYYQDSAGAAPDRVAGAQWLRSRIGEVPVSRVLVIGGAQCALFAILATLLQSEDVLCVPALTYPGLRAVAERQNLRLASVALDSDGFIPSSFEEACRRDKPRALYCVPTINNPTSATMPLQRREEIARIARKHGVRIVEDDAYGALPREAPPPIVALAPDITWHVATLSKCATPGLRVAYVVTPDVTHSLRLAAQVRATSLMAPPLMSALASRWALDGTLEAITAAIRNESAARQVIARQALEGMDFVAHPEGHHLWLRLPDGWPRAELSVHARQSGLSIVPSDAFAIGAAPEAIRVSLGAATDRETLKYGLGLLAMLLSQRPGALSAVV
jgi:DNA-binding transcriptional MocR family regulator